MPLRVRRPELGSFDTTHVDKRRSAGMYVRMYVRM